MLYMCLISKIFAIFAVKLKQSSFMELGAIIELIGSIGFPIVMCLILLQYMDKQNEKHDKEIHDLTDTINNNTKILTELTTLIKTMIK